MLPLLFVFSALGLLTGEVWSCESDSSSLLPRSCPLVAESSEYRQQQRSHPQCSRDATVTTTFDGTDSCQRNIKPQPELTTTTLNMTSGSTLVSHLSGQFSYDLHMGLFLDKGLVKEVTADTKLQLKQRLWVKLEVQGVMEALGLSVQSCWATDEPPPDASTQHSLITDGCPDPGEATVAVVSNGASLTSIFSFRVFRFVSKGSRDVFLHCQAKLCILAHGCVPSCTTIE